MKFRCSQLGKIMTPPRAKKDLLSKTATDYLDEIIIAHKYGREKDIMNKYMQKGLMMEDASITLLSEVTEKFYGKNEQFYENEYIQGTPDVVDDVVIDVKTSWDIFTFSSAEVTRPYYWQLVGYMWLTGIHKAKLAYCLVNAPEELITDELRRLSWKMMMIDTQHPLYIEAEEKVRHNMVFDDIPAKERVKVFDVEFDVEEVEQLKEKIDICREYVLERI